MSASYFNERRTFSSIPIRLPRTVFDRVERRKAGRHSPPPAAIDGEEQRFVFRAVTLMAILSLVPLILFYILNFLYPEFLWIPIAPN